MWANCNLGRKAPRTIKNTDYLGPQQLSEIMKKLMKTLRSWSSSIHGAVHVWLLWLAKHIVFRMCKNGADSRTRWLQMLSATQERIQQQKAVIPRQTNPELSVIKHDCQCSSVACHSCWYIWGTQLIFCGSEFLISRCGVGLYCGEQEVPP